MTDTARVSDESVAPGADTAPDATAAAAGGARRAGGEHREHRLRPRLSAAERRSVLDALMVRPSAEALRRFIVLLCLSVVVATVGLLQDSTAVVIGAMMMAPLMAPIMGVAASLVMGWGARLLGGLAVVGLSTVASMAIAWAMTVLMPSAGSTMPAEALARSSPDVRDLLVALAAGAAGAYATVRKEVSGALPGVAVAVALVPPLSSAGVLMGRGQPELARGAVLLFAANLFGIVLAAAVVFVLTGFMPAARLRANPARLVLTLALITVPTLAVATVLTARFIHSADQAHTLQLATQSITRWLGPDDDLNRVTLVGSKVQVGITGKAAPPLQALTEDLGKTLGHATTVDLRWTPSTDGTSRTPARPALTIEQAQPVVEHWLAEQSLALDGLAYNDATLVVSTSGDRPPHQARDLEAAIATHFTAHPPVSLAWTHRTTPNAVADSPKETEKTARTTIAAWTETHPGQHLLTVSQTGTALTVTLTGEDKPDTGTLQEQLRTAFPRNPVTIQWLPTTILGQTTPRPAASFPAEAAPDRTVR
ncbi:DUF389 domain-containing protein [Streptomyces avidinii]|uniref:DUF389 domain-containing protein n=1 Tax=Streptomyces TaxID=1883 RepID=UPI000F4307A8|nr:DUF389 domain-containing protein [Streptomyces sp. ADI95-16]AYV26436.1 hypothetical protein EES41_06840 [Streptomyces sp. ADI95-16]